MKDRKTITTAFMRVAKDSSYQMDWADVANFVANLLNVHTLDVWSAMGSIDNMQRIANGTHSACARGQI